MVLSPRTRFCETWTDEHTDDNLFDYGQTDVFNLIQGKKLGSVGHGMSATELLGGFGPGHGSRVNIQPKLQPKPKNPSRDLTPTRRRALMLILLVAPYNLREAPHSNPSQTQQTWFAPHLPSHSSRLTLLIPHPVQLGTAIPPSPGSEILTPYIGRLARTWTRLGIRS